MQFRPITTSLFVISGFHLLGESAAVYRRLSSLRKTLLVAYLGRPPQTGHLFSATPMPGFHPGSGGRLSKSQICCGTGLNFG
jgi:hypothetical protein